MPRDWRTAVIGPGLLALILALALGCDVGGGAVPICHQHTTLFLVRHAEKAYGVADPPLTEEGELRAEELAFILENVKLDAIYSTPYQRTLQTAQAVADTHQLEVIEYTETNASVFLNKLLMLRRGGTVLIVGHSNTIPSMLYALTNGTESHGVSGYDDLFLVQTEYVGKSKVWPLQYHRPQSE